MPYSGDGEFTLTYNWVQDAAAGINILASRMQAQEDDIAANGLSNCITRDGQSPPTTDIPMGGFKLTGLANGSAATDAVALGQLTAGSLSLTVTELTVTTNGINVQAGGLSVTGNTALVGSLSLNGSLTGTGNISIPSGSLTVGSSTSLQAVSIAGNISSVGGTNTFGGATQFNSSLGVLGLTALGQVNITGNISAIGGTNAFSGTTNFNAITTTTIAASGVITGQGSASVNTSGWALTSSGTGAFGPGVIGYAILAPSGNMLASNYFAASDARLKIEVETLDEAAAIDWINSSRPVTYRKKIRYQDPDSDARFEAGFIAQEQVIAGYGRYVGVGPCEGLPAIDGCPADQMLTLPPGYQIAFLTAALKITRAELQSALTRIERLEQGL